MSQSQEVLDSEAYPEFLQKFKCSGPRIPQIDKNTGEELWQLWKILNKSIGDDDEMVYEVQYYENGKNGENLVYPVLVAEIEDCYPEEAREWEKAHGRNWEKKYGSQPRHWSTGKRAFDDTPSKQTRNPKRSKESSTLSDQNDEDEEMKDAASEDEDPFGGPSLGGTGSGLFSIAIRPPQPGKARPKFGSSPTRSGKDESQGSEDSSKDDGSLANKSDDNMSMDNNKSTDNRQIDSESDEGGSIRGAGPRSLGFQLRQGLNAANAAFEESQMELENDDDDEPVILATQARDRDDGDSSEYDVYSDRLINSLSEGIYSLLINTLELEGLPCDRWITKRRDSEKCDFELLLFALFLMLAGWDSLILIHLVRGDLPKQVKINGDLHQRLEKLMSPNDLRTPCIYIHYFVNRDGDSPTPRTFMAMFETARLYVESLGCKNKSAKLALKIDTAVKPPKKWQEKGRELADAGHRRYIDNQTQADNCIEMIEIAEKRFEDLPLDEPLERAFTEVGFAIDPDTRLRNHREHFSSNYLMNLFDAISAAFYQGEYQMAEYVVHHTVHPSHAMYAEILASRFCLAYTTQGGGFSHAPAGHSHGGAITKEKEDPQYYTNLQEELANDLQFLVRVEQNFDAMRRKSDKYGNYNKLLEREDEVREKLKAYVEQARTAVAEADADKTEIRLMKDMEEDIGAADPLMEIMRLAEELSDEDEDEDAETEM